METTAADHCREKGWTPGTTLRGTKGETTTTVRITAIGEDAVLGRRLTTNGKPDYRDDRQWGFNTRGWTWERV